MADIKSVPAAASGVSASSTTTAWSFGSWVEITSGLSVGLKVIGIQFQESQNNPSVDTTMQRLFEIGIGASGSEATKLQIPSSVRSDTTAYGHYLPPVNRVWLPEPYLIPANTRVAVRVADSTTTAVTYDGIKLIYEENLPPSVTLNSPDDGATITDTTPTLEFTGTDPEANDIQYNVQIDTVNTFDSQTATSFPVSEAPVSTGFAFSVTSMAINMPGTVNAGDLLIALVEVRNAGTWTNPTGWNDIATLTQAGGGSVGKLDGFYKIADGTEASTTPTWTASTGTTAVWQVIRITGWHGTTPPEALTASGDATSADPPELTPSWGSGKTLWLAVAGHAAVSTDAFTAAPTDYSGFQNDGASSGGSAVSVASAYRELTASSENPGTFTAGGSNRWWAAATIAIRQGSAVSPLLDKISGTDSGFANIDTPADTNPFNSGDKIGFTVQGVDELSPGTYYWRVRAKDPSGSNAWGSWSSIRSFTVQAGTITSDNRSARTKGQATTSNTRNARTKGLNTASDIRDARTKGIATSSDTRNARTKGVATTSDNRSARIKGQTITSDTRGARTKGQETSTNNRPARTKGVDTTSNTRSARTKGLLTASDIRSARTKGVAAASDTRNARIKGYLTASDTRNARIKGVATISDTRGARTKGLSTTSDTRNARTKGVATASDTRGARAKGQITTSDTRNARTKGQATASDTRAAKTIGVSVSVISDSRNARTKGLDTLSNNRGARIKGFDTAGETRNARTKGYLTTSDTRGARTKGELTASDFRDAHTKGVATTSDTRGARIKGVISSYRNAKVKGPEPNYPKFIFVDGELAIHLFGKFYMIV